MKTYLREIVPQTTRDTCVSKRCDMCKEVHSDYDVSGDSWNRRTSYDVMETRVELDEGSSFPEGRDVERLTCDICPTCFQEVLVPFLESKGVQMRKEDNGW